MDNPLKSLVPKDPDTGPGIAKELGEAARTSVSNRQALNPSPEAPKAPVGAPAHMTPTKGPYGTNPGTGEKSPADFNKKYPDLPKLHKGGTVPKTGPYIMKEGEKVLTGDQHKHITSALSLAQSALSHDPVKDKEPELPVHLKEMHIKQLHTGGFHVQKHDGKGGMTEHGAPDNDSVVGHFMDHMAHPDEDEEAAEAGDHDMSAADAEHKAIGG
jgi:hypothetical protein